MVTLNVVMFQFGKWVENSFHHGLFCFEAGIFFFFTQGCI